MDAHNVVVTILPNPYLKVDNTLGKISAQKGVPVLTFLDVDREEIAIRKLYFLTR